MTQQVVQKSSKVCHTASEPFGIEKSNNFQAILYQKSNCFQAKISIKIIRLDKPYGILPSAIRLSKNSHGSASTR